MAIVSNTFSIYLIDTRFDLDEALTDLPENLSQQIAYSNSLVADMPTVLTTDDIVCAVCMEGFQSTGMGGKRVPCGHVYHEACISSWLSHRPQCPLCRCHISN